MFTEDTYELGSGFIELVIANMWNELLPICFIYWHRFYRHSVQLLSSLFILELFGFYTLCMLYSPLMNVHLVQSMCTNQFEIAS